MQFLFAMRQPLTWPFTECCSNEPVMRSLQLILRKLHQGEHRPGRGMDQGNVRCRRMQRSSDVFASWYQRAIRMLQHSVDRPARPIVILVGGRGAGKKIPRGWVGGIQHFGGEGGTPTHPCDHPTPLLLCRRGGPPYPAHLTLHAKYRFWNWNHWGVVPSFLPDKGGGGLSMKIENPGVGGGKSFGGHPPAGI